MHFEIIFVISGLFVLTSVQGAEREVPEKFLGTFKLDHDENFDQYLEARGLSLERF